MIIVSRLKVILVERRIKFGEFAKDVGISQAALSTLMNKEDALPTLRVAYRIAEALELTVEEIWQKK